MSTVICKNFFLYLSGFYLYKKTLNLKFSNHFFTYFSLFSSVLLALICHIMKEYFFFPYTSTSVLIYCILLCIVFRNNIRLTLVISCFSFILSSLTFFCTSGIVSILAVVVIYNFYIPSQFLLTLLAGALSYALCHAIFSIRRFKGGMKFLYKPEVQRTGFILSLFVLTGIIICQYSYFQLTSSSFYPILFLFLCIFIVLFWWQKNITKNYLDKLRRLELESLRQELAEKDEAIQKLTESNDSLARIIHKDNKLVPAMLAAVTDYLESVDNGTVAECHSRGQTLAAQLQELASDRIGVLEASARTSQALPLTGHAAVDAMLRYMQKRADMEHITYTVKLHPDFPEKIGTEISEADLSHLLSDLIENAIIASKYSEKKSILVHLGLLYDAPTIEISDNGAPFDPEVYQDFGLQSHSTHMGEGGSGIGLMDVWELKKKYAASLHIYEYAPETSPFTKKLCLVFDHKRHYLIRSYRPKDIIKLQTRNDLFVMPQEEISALIQA